MCCDVVGRKPLPRMSFWKFGNNIEDRTGRGGGGTTDSRFKIYELNLLRWSCDGVTYNYVIFTYRPSVVITSRVINAHACHLSTHCLTSLKIVEYRTSLFYDSICALSSSKRRQWRLTVSSIQQWRSLPLCNNNNLHKERALSGAYTTSYGWRLCVFCDRNYYAHP